MLPLKPTTMYLTQPDSNRVRNDVFKRILGGIKESKPIPRIANQILEDLSCELILIDDPIVRRQTIRDIYQRIQGVDKVRRFNYNYVSGDKNRIAMQAIDEVLYRFRTKYRNYL